MKRILKYLFLSSSISCAAQNLVPNPSFEVYDTCPDHGQINYAVGWSKYRQTPDYYNGCAPDTNNPSWSVPSNIYGFQYARTGSAYAGLATRSTVSTSRECIGIQLNQPLIVGTRYYASFYVNKVEKYLNMASNKIGMKLLTYPCSQSFPVYIDNHAQIYTDSIITDTLNWTRISGSFIADSAYRYLSIGNFFDDSLTSYTIIDSSSWAYYYIDDVYLSDISDTSIENIISLHTNSLLKIYPNPAHDWIVFEAPNNGRLFISDAVGRTCFQSEITSFVKVNISRFNKGIYFLFFNSSKGNFYQKFIIQ